MIVTTQNTCTPATCIQLTVRASSHMSVFIWRLPSGRSLCDLIAICTIDNSSLYLGNQSDVRLFRWSLCMRTPGNIRTGFLINFSVSFMCKGTRIICARLFLFQSCPYVFYQLRARLVRESCFTVHLDAWLRAPLGRVLPLLVSLQTSRWLT